jgi:hypothetical protein
MLLEVRANSQERVSLCKQVALSGLRLDQRSRIKIAECQLHELVTVVGLMFSASSQCAREI